MPPCTQKGIRFEMRGAEIYTVKEKKQQETCCVYLRKTFDCFKNDLSVCKISVIPLIRSEKFTTMCKEAPSRAHIEQKEVAKNSAHRTANTMETRQTTTAKTRRKKNGSNSRKKRNKTLI
jgi:hypothetical protein